MSEPVRLTVSQVLNDLENGYTRTTTSGGYQGEGKSIEEKYGLNKKQVMQLFQHEKLKGRKTKFPPAPAFILTDDTDTTPSVEDVDVLSETTEDYRETVSEDQEGSTYRAAEVTVSTSVKTTDIHNDSTTMESDSEENEGDDYVNQVEGAIAAADGLEEEEVNEDPDWLS